MNKPTLYMLIGIPASGKSTWVRNNTNKCVIASTDDYIEKRAEEAGKTYNDVFSCVIEEATANLEAVVKNAIASKADVIWDQTNLDRKSRARKLRQFKDYCKVAVLFKTPSEEVLTNRLNSRVGKTIPIRVIESMKLRFEEPTLDEGFDEILVIKND